MTTEQMWDQRIDDPFRWLEDDHSDATQAFTAQQNARTEAFLAGRPDRERWRQRLTELLRLGSCTAPTPRGGRYFYLRRDPGQDQPVLLVREGRSGPERALVDPNSLSRDALSTIDWFYPSGCSRWLAYGVSRGGDEQSALHVLNVDTGEHLPTRIDRTRSCSLAWLPDHTGFFYTRNPKPGSVPAGEEHYHRHVYCHRLGDDPANDERVWGADRPPEETPTVALSSNGRYLVVNASVGWSESELHILDRDRPERGFTPIVIGAGALYGVRLVGERLVIHTNEGAPNYRLFMADLAAPARENWREVIPESDHALVDFRVVGDTIAAHYLIHVTSSIQLFSLDGELRRFVELPPMGAVDQLTGETTGHELCFAFTSFTTPTTAYCYDLQTRQSTVFAESASPIDTTNFLAQQVWFDGRDGARVPMFVIHRRDLVRHGANPTLLTGYGGFNISRTPAFSPSALAWIERGGVWALPNLRGGGEFGEAWHAAGKRAQKQNVFDDFHAAAEWLIANRYTNPAKLAARGRSNGGLLMGAALTQRPDLFQAIACEVPLLDMLRFHHFLIARYWTPEYGCADASAEEFAWLRAYSPYHNVRPNVTYPATLFTTAEGDSRVHPLHARKMAALLQHLAQSGQISVKSTGAHAPGDPPLYLRVEADAGHGVGKPTRKLVAEETDVWTFLADQIGLL